LFKSNFQKQEIPLYAQVDAADIFIYKRGQFTAGHFSADPKCSLMRLSVQLITQSSIFRIFHETVSPAAIDIYQHITL